MSLQKYNAFTRTKRASQGLSHGSVKIIRAISSKLQLCSYIYLIIYRKNWCMGCTRMRHLEYKKRNKIAHLSEQ